MKYEARVLEVGCGKHRDPRADVAIDILSDSDADYIMDVLNIQFPSGAFDEVLMFEVLEHLQMPLATLQEISRVLKNNGNLILSVPNVYHWRLILRWFFRGRVSAEHLFFKFLNIQARRQTSLL